jgi:oligopeptide/dipeptide ABC transporter ATP-binding protein
MPNEILYSIKNLTVEYKTRAGPVKAVDNVTFDIYRGEILGLVGESGCGKSTLGKALMRLKAGLVDITGGELWLDGQDLLKLSDQEMSDLRGAELGMVFQDPMTSLNPVQRIVDHLTETIKTHEPDTTEKEARARSEKLVERLGIRRERLNEYPHQMSGGMRQRVMIGLGLVLNASLIIADEATTSLDVIVEAKLVDLLREIRDEFWLTILLITHNIALVAQVADRVAVMYAGEIVEIGSCESIFDDPLHPYSQGLMQSVPSISLDEHELLFKMPGEPPDLAHPPPGCRFHPRCPWVMGICSREEPDFMEVAPDRWVHCWLYQDHPEKERETLKVAA